MLTTIQNSVRLSRLTTLPGRRRAKGNDGAKSQRSFLFQDGLIAAISEGRVNVTELSHAMSRLWDTGINRFARWAKGLRDVARISPMHAKEVTLLITQVLHGDPSKSPRDVSALLELLFELLSETGFRVDDQKTRIYIQSLKAGGKAGKLA